MSWLSLMHSQHSYLMVALKAMDTQRITYELSIYHYFDETQWLQGFHVKELWFLYHT